VAVKEDGMTNVIYVVVDIAGMDQPELERVPRLLAAMGHPEVHVHEAGRVHTALTRVRRAVGRL
jgi:hypothetical protein